MRPIAPNIPQPGEYDVLERRPRRDHGIGLDGRPVVNPKLLADRDERFESQYTAGLAFEAKRSTANKLLELVRPGLEAAVRDEIIEAGRGLDFDRHHEMQQLSRAMVESLRSVLVSHFEVETEETSEE